MAKETISTTLKILYDEEGKASHLLVDIGDLDDGVIETLEILSDPKAYKSLRKSLKEAAEGKVFPLEDLKKKWATK